MGKENRSTVLKAMLSIVQERKEFDMMKCAKQSSENVSSSKLIGPRPGGGVSTVGQYMAQGDAQALKRSVQHVDDRISLRKYAEIQPE